MNYYLGIDLGSTTTKAVLMDEKQGLVGRGITNTRSNYFVASAVAKSEALLSARFNFFGAELKNRLQAGRKSAEESLRQELRRQEYVYRLGRLRQMAEKVMEGYGKKPGKGVRETVVAALDGVDAKLDEVVPAEGESRFFRDAVTAAFTPEVEALVRDGRVSFEGVMAVIDRAVLDEENEPLDIDVMKALKDSARRLFCDMPETLNPVLQAVEASGNVAVDPVNEVGTGYGRARLPFTREQIKSEILCHGLGAHYFFPHTRTVLDIGGQDTKAIQVDEDGVVTSFQMNDRCAAGCGRYLGYIAEELSIGLHELGPLARKATRDTKINSTCTVFAGAELRERLGLGEKREDILKGLHRAIVLRAMSLLARSGGVSEQFTFTGGVAKNVAAVDALRQLIDENYGEKTVNIHPDSIYTGAVGAAIYALRGAVA